MAKKQAFNPIKEEKDGAKARRVVWTTEVLDIALKGLDEGKRLVANPFYENNTKILKCNLVFTRTDEEKIEWLKCRKNILYFAEKYCKLMTPKGIKHVQLRDYQKRYLKHLEDHNMSIMVSCRQAGKTTTSAIFMLHYILFNYDKNALVLGNKRKTAIEILDKVKKIFYEIPFFLKPGVEKWNEGEIVLDNGCRCMADATTMDSGISFTFHCALLDEFAKIKKNIQEPFYNHVLPTLTAAAARVMISSTVNGKELFYRLYMGAKLGENDYAPFAVEWKDVPEWNPKKQCFEPRDEAWHQRMIANYGSEEAFEGQFGINFDVTSSALIKRAILRARRDDAIKFVNKEMLGVFHSDCWFWHPDFNPMTDLRKEFIVIPVDIAEGLGGDYTVMTIYRMEKGKYGPRLVAVGYFRSNQVPRDEYALSLMQVMNLYANNDHTLISIEYNTYGELFIRDIKDLTNAKGFENFDINCLVKYYNEGGTKYVQGIKLTSGNKTPHCLLFQEDYERDFIRNDAEMFIFELENFCDDGTKHYKASFGHDDMVMSTVQLEFVKKTLQYKLFIEDFEEKIGKPFDEETYNPYENYTPQVGVGAVPIETWYDFDNDMQRIQNANLNRLTSYGNNQ